jgi:hypothetical protein
MSLLAKLERNDILKLLQMLEEEMERPLMPHEELYFLDQLRRLNARYEKLLMRNRGDFVSSIADNLSKADGESLERRIKKEMDRPVPRLIARSAKLKFSTGQKASEIFNPKSEIKSKVFELNSRNRDLATLDEYKLRWVVGPNRGEQGFLQSHLLGRIVGIAIDEVRIPKNTLLDSVRLERTNNPVLLVEEFRAQSFFSQGKDFHFVLTRSVPPWLDAEIIASWGFYFYRPRGNFMFNEPFTDLTTITLSMGFNHLSVPFRTCLYKLPYSAISATNPAVITWPSSPPVLNDGGLLWIRGFTTNDASADADVIAEMNKVHTASGNNVSCSIPIDLSSVTFPTDPSASFIVDIFDSSFICQLRIFYLDDEGS